MRDFSGKIAVVTGGGSGIGRALVQALTAEGCSVAMCDIREADMLETVRLAEKTAVQGVRISTFVADVAQEKETLAFRDHTGEQHETDHVHLLFNNAGIGGGGSMINTPRAEWDRTFAVCWFGVYYNARAFLPMLLRQVFSPAVASSVGPTLAAIAIYVLMAAVLVFRPSGLFPARG